MNCLLKFLVLNLLIFTPILLVAQSAPITLDGNFDDWTSDLATITDNSESISGIDLLEMQVSNDDEFLFIRIKTNTEFDLMENTVPQNVRLSLDTDNDESTGFPLQSGFGSELTIVFRGHSAHFNVEPYSQVTFFDFSMLVSPTVSSNEFEIAIKRDALPDGVNALFTSSTIKILLHNELNNDKIPNEGNFFEYTFDEIPVLPYVPIELNKESTNFIRVVAYNTKGNGLNKPDKLPHFENIITVLNPDILALSECGNTNPQYVKDLLDEWLPLNNIDGWFIDKYTNEDMITASRWPIIEKWEHLPSQFPTFIDLPESYQTDLLFTNAHLKYGLNDHIRQEEVDSYIEFILDAKSAGGVITISDGTPFVYAGDLNLVGLSQQLTTLLTGDIQNTSVYGNGGAPDWDDTNVADFTGLQTDKRFDYTWRNDNSVYPPGKLDYIIYSDNVISAEKSFVLRTEAMSAERLLQYGLLENSTSSATDHFPVVTDLLINTNSGISLTTSQKHKVYPNPATTEINISFNNVGKYLVRISNLEGENVFLEEVVLEKSIIDIEKFPTGIYIITIISENEAPETHSLIKQ